MPTSAYLNKLLSAARNTAYRVVIDGLSKEFWVGNIEYGGLPVTRPLRCGDIVCGEIDPSTGSTYKCGANYTTSGAEDSLQNVMKISPFSLDLGPKKRIPSFPVLTVELADPTGYVSGLTDMEEREVWIYHVLGAKDLLNDPSQLVFHGKIEAWEKSEANFIWSMRCVSILHELNKKLGGVETYLTADLDSGDTGSTSVHDAQLFPEFGYIRIESRDYWPEIAYYSSKGSANLNISSRGIASRTPYATNGVDHAIDDVVIACYYTGIGGLPLKDQIYNILTGSGPWACGISTYWINQATFDNYVPPWGTEEQITNFDCIYWEETEAKKILEDMLFYIGAFLYLDSDMKICIAADSEVTETAAVIRDLDIMERPEIEDAGELINKILIQNPIHVDTQNWRTGNYTKKDQASIDKYGEQTLNLSLHFIKKPSTPNTAPKPGGDPPDPDDPPDFASYVYYLANVYLLSFYSTPSTSMKVKGLLGSHLVNLSDQGVAGDFGLPSGVVMKKKIDYGEFETEFSLLRHGGDA